MKGFEEMPESVKSFLETGTFKVQQHPGTQPFMHNMLILWFL